MMVECDGHRFEWIEDWVRIPATPSAQKNGRTHGIAVAADGTVIVFHQANPAVVLYRPDGSIRGVWGDRFPGAHGLTLVEEEGLERLWLTDETTGAVVKTTITGRPLMEIGRPEHPAYDSGSYSPTWVAVNEERRGGTGDVWVADGYGSGLVHRYDADGRYIETITGDEGAGRFDCPHGLYFRQRSGTNELVVADRGNARFQVYDESGKFVESFGEDALELPCCCFEWGGLLVVPELNARLTLLDSDGRLMGYLGRNEDVCGRDDWPNVPEAERREGKFNSPHAAACDADGNIYVVEWILGGRITKLSVAGDTGGWTSS